jgi:hypothetical protein
VKTKYTEEQNKLLESLELAMAALLLDDFKKEGTILACIVEWLHKGEPVTAVLEAEAAGVEEGVLNTIRKTFNVAKF